jgi:hypothetical protein
MFELNKGISLVVMILSVIVLMIIGLFVYWEFFFFAEEKDNIDFSKEGNILINNPGFIENVWYLSYETPGAPANSVKLSFDEKSVCENQKESCLDLTNGERVEIRGIENNNEVLVRELKTISFDN